MNETEELIYALDQLIEKRRKSNTFTTANGKWTIPDNQIRINLKDLIEVMKPFKGNPV